MNINTVPTGNKKFVLTVKERDTRKYVIVISIENHNFKDIDD
jgi:hypothetical protein